MYLKQNFRKEVNNGYLLISNLLKNSLKKTNVVILIKKSEIIFLLLIAFAYNFV